MDYLSIGLAILKFANYILGLVQYQQASNAGRDAEIAAESKAILARTAQGKLIFDKLSSMADPDIDDILKQLEK